MPPPISPILNLKSSSGSAAKTGSNLKKETGNISSSSINTNTTSSSSSTTSTLNEITTSSSTGTGSAWKIASSAPPVSSTAQTSKGKSFSFPQRKVPSLAPPEEIKPSVTKIEEKPKKILDLNEEFPLLPSQLKQQQLQKQQAVEVEVEEVKPTGKVGFFNDDDDWLDEDNIDYNQKLFGDDLLIIKPEDTHLNTKTTTEYEEYENTKCVETKSDVIPKQINEISAKTEEIRLDNKTTHLSWRRSTEDTSISSLVSEDLKISGKEPPPPPHHHRAGEHRAEQKETHKFTILKRDPPILAPLPPQPQPPQLPEPKPVVQAATTKTESKPAPKNFSTKGNSTTLNNDTKDEKKEKELIRENNDNDNNSKSNSNSNKKNEENIIITTTKGIKINISKNKNKSDSTGTSSSSNSNVIPDTKIATATTKHQEKETFTNTKTNTKTSTDTSTSDTSNKLSITVNIKPEEKKKKIVYTTSYKKAQSIDPQSENK